MTAPTPTPMQVRPAVALLAVLSEWHYLRIAVPHNLAAELGSKQLEAAYKAGTFPPPDWPLKTVEEARTNLALLRRSLFSSGILAAGLLALAVCIAAVAGKIHPSLPPDYGKVVSYLGAALAAWGTILQFRPPPQTWRGTFMHELAHSAAKQLLAGTGIVLAASGALWWQ
jgi:hypothetical protein